MLFQTACSLLILAVAPSNNAVWAKSFPISDHPAIEETIHHPDDAGIPQGLVVPNADGGGFETAPAAAVSGLRGGQTYEAALAMSVSKEDSDVAALVQQSPQDRADHVAKMQVKLNDLKSQLFDVDNAAKLEGVTEFASLIQDLQDHMETSEQEYAKVMDFMVREEEDKAKPQAVPRRHLVSVDGTTQDIGRQPRQDQTAYDQHKHQKKQYRKVFQQHRAHAQNIQNGHYHKQIIDLQEAIFNGDSSHVNAFADTMMQSHYARFGKTNVPSQQPHQQQQRRHLSKQDMCSTLAGCASRMSMYDMFVYYHSDDIDPATGDIDENIVVYDEYDFVAKSKKIRELTTEILPTYEGGAYRTFNWTNEAHGMCKGENRITTMHECREAALKYGGGVDSARRVVTFESIALPDSSLAFKVGDAVLEPKLIASETECRYDYYLDHGMSLRECQEEVAKEVESGHRYCKGDIFGWRPDGGHCYCSETETCHERRDDRNMNLYRVGNKDLAGYMKKGSGSTLVAKNTECRYDDTVGRGMSSLEECEQAVIKRANKYKSGWGCTGNFFTYDHDDGDCMCGDEKDDCQTRRYARNRDLYEIHSTEHAVVSAFVVQDCLASNHDCGAGHCVSVESKEHPGYFMRHQNMTIKLHEKDGTDAFLQEASFCLKSSLAKEEHVVLESTNLPGYLVSPGDDGSLMLSQNSTVDAKEFERNATFKMTLATMRDNQWLRVVNHTLGPSDFSSVSIPEEVEESEAADLPCGCFVDTEGMIKFNKGGHACGHSPNPDMSLVCRVDVHESCDDLLQEFHRTIEHGDVPAWEGATVGQVCLAEGTTTYVKAEDVAETVFTRNLKSWRIRGGRDSRSTIDDAASKISSRDVTGPLVELLFGETVNCAEELYKADINPQRNEDFFPFSSDRGELQFPALDPNANRDEHGQPLQNLELPAAKAYNSLRDTFERCVRDLADSAKAELHGKLGNNPSTSQVKEYALEEFVDPAISKCAEDFYGAMRQGIEMVFGDKVSPGFICGVKDAIVNDGKDMPGTCCRDAPYQMEGDDWGKKYQCALEGETPTCLSHGPFFSWMSTDACDVVGGTWCPNKVDCSELEECIVNFKARAVEMRQPSFLAYLNDAPVIRDPSNAKQCMKTREYFGFDGYFSNDGQICQDIEQLQYTRDFTFLDDFFDQGSDGEGSGTEEIDIQEAQQGKAKEVPDLKLTEPDHSASDAGPVQNGQAWRATNFALDRLVAGYGFAAKAAEAVACPYIPFVGTFPCEVIKFVIVKMMTMIQKVSKVILDISVFTYGELAELDNITPMVTGEEVAVVKTNMAETGDYIKGRFEDLNDYLYQSFDLQNGDLATKAEKIVDYMKTNTDLILADIKKVEEKIKIEVGLELAVASANSFLLVVTKEGKTTKPDDITIEGVDASGSSSIVTDYTQKKIGGEGRYLIILDKSVQEKLFLVTIELEVADEEMAVRTSVVTL